MPLVVEDGRVFWKDDNPAPAKAPPQTVPIVGSGAGTGVGTGTFGKDNRPIGNAGTPIKVGVTPGKQQQWGGWGGIQLPGFNNTGIDYDAVRQALAAREGQVDNIYGRTLGVGSGQFGALESTLMQMLTNPQGYNPKDLALARTRIAEREAGVRGTNLEQLGVSKLGPRVADSALRESIRGQSAQRITDAELGLDFQNQQMRQQNILAAIQAALGTAQVSAGYNSDYARLKASMFDPVAAGSGGGGEGPGGAMLPNERGLAENRLPGESLADQLRREAAAWQAYYGGATTPTG